MKMLGKAALMLALGLTRLTGHGAETNKPAAPGPKPAPAATNNLAAFHLHPGFRIELAAAEPMVASPAAMAFDENGRLFVVEMPANAERRGSSPPLGRVRLLEEPDEEGVYKSSKVYADDLPLPSAVACYEGGIFVAAGPDILYLKDTKGDGSADVRKVVLSGFGGTNPPTAGRLLNNFNWGLDNRIHVATAGMGGTITSSNWPGEQFPIRLSDFCFDPRTLAVFPEAGPSQSGLSFDSRGRRFTCDLARPLRLTVYDTWYTPRNPFFIPAPGLVDAAAPGTTVLHRQRKPEAANSENARRQTALVAAAITNAQGCLIYRGSLFTTGFVDNAFVPCPGAHAVHRFVLRENGLGVSAQQAPDEKGAEFLQSEDPSFFPVQAVEGPEGGLYVADRQEARERGRIYRVVPEGYKRQKLPQLGKDRVIDLAGTLASPNGWHRDTAARLLYERQPTEAAPLLSNMVALAKSPLARIHALYSLDGLGAIRRPQVLRALRDPDERVREHGLRLLGRIATPALASDEEVWTELVKLVNDSSPRVRLQLAFALGEVNRPQQAPALARLLIRDPANPWMQTAVFSSTAHSAGQLFAALAANAPFRNSPNGLRFLQNLAASIGVKGQQNEVGEVLGLLVGGPHDPAQVMKLLYALGDGLRRAGSSLALVDPQGKLQLIYPTALDLALNAGAAEAARADAVRLLGVSPLTFADTSDWLLALCDPQPLPQLRAAALATLGNYDDPAVIGSVLSHWGGLSPPLRTDAVSSLLKRSNRWRPAMEAIASGRISPAVLSPEQMNLLRTSADSVVRQRAIKLFGPVLGDRPDLVSQFKPALRLKGSPGRGRDIYLARCSSCHQIAGPGLSFGPDLVEARLMDKTALLAKILAPNAELTGGFETSVLESKQGEIEVGIVSDQSRYALTLRRPQGARVWSTLQVERLEEQIWSLMPDNFGAQLSIQDMADLLEYLSMGER